jgi:hypothetical protein
MESRIFVALFLAAVVLGPALAQAVGAGREESGAPVAIQAFGNLEVDTSTQNGQQIAQIMERQQERLQVATATGTQLRSMNTHGYRVSSYAQSLIDASDFMGGIGPQVSRVARELNGSSANMTAYEERIQNRNAFMKFLFGSDREAVMAAEQQVNRTRERIMELEQLQGQVDDPQLKAMFQEQLRLMNQELNQTETMLQNEKRSRGIFGFLIGP